MAFGVIHRFSGGTKEQFDATLEKVHPGEQLADGQLMLAAGADGGDYVIVATFESQQAWEDFRDGTLMPILQEGVPDGFSGPPQETAVAFEYMNAG